ncbi:hypothetical protein SuNHUV7_06840 (plasmid) [Pseudoseohaeicola sp. NH-UV-7]|uniref:hypothetical protein n=1 Tax=Sulfitobacter sp. TBRI5 TaxID=2989732 RepID=UPI003A78B9D7
MKLFAALLLVVSLSACATSAIMTQGSAKPYNITSVSVDVSQLTSKQLISLPPAKQINADLTSSLQRELAAGSDKNGRSAIFVLQVNAFTLGDSGRETLNQYSVSTIGGTAEIRDAKSGEVLVPGGNVFSATPRSIADAAVLTGAILTLNPNGYKTRQQDYQDTINNFAVTIRQRLF